MGRALMYPAMAIAASAVIVFVVWQLVRMARKAARARAAANDAEARRLARWEAFQRPESGQWAIGVECVAELSTGWTQVKPDEEVEYYPFSTDALALELKFAELENLAARMNDAAKR